MRKDEINSKPCIKFNNPTYRNIENYKSTTNYINPTYKKPKEILPQCQE